MKIEKALNDIKTGTGGPEALEVAVKCMEICRDIVKDLDYEIEYYEKNKPVDELNKGVLKGFRTARNMAKRRLMCLEE